MRYRGLGEHHSLVADGRTLLRRLGQSKLHRHLHAMLLIRPSRGRSIVYATLGTGPLLDALAHDSHFCRDTALGGMLHPRRASFRELRTPLSLHVALEAHERISAHLDRESPTVGRRDDGACLYTRARTLRHIWRDVVPSLGRPTGGHSLPYPHITRTRHAPSVSQPL
jgi:hypothetical protein